MKIWTTVLLLLFAGLINAQTNQQKAIIEINSKFTLKLVEVESGGYNYTLASKESYNQLLDLKKTQNLITESAPDEIQGILAYAKIGKEVNAFLILQSGLEKPLTYDLYIKRNDRQNTEKVSVINLFPDVSSTEIWPFRIDYIVFSDFDDVIDED